MTRDSGSVSLELVLLTPVLVLLTLFVLWAGRGGSAALTVDLAAEEAATAAAVCCEEDTAGAEGRNAMVRDVLESRPNLDFLCVGGVRPNGPTGAAGPPQWLDETWARFEAGRSTGGVGVLDVQFMCETDGAVAPMRGLLPTVTFHGQASEVVTREPATMVGFSASRFSVREGEHTHGTDTYLVFVVESRPPEAVDITLDYDVVSPSDPAVTTVEPDDLDGVNDLAADLPGSVTIPAGQSTAEIRLKVLDDDVHEGDEELTLEITRAYKGPPGNPVIIAVDPEDAVAVGEILDDEESPYLQIVQRPVPEVIERGNDRQIDDPGQDLEWTVRLGDRNGNEVRTEAAVTVRPSIMADPAAEGLDCTTWERSGKACGWAVPGDYKNPPAGQLTLGGTTGTTPANPSSATVTVTSVDDYQSPEPEPDEIVVLELLDPSGAPVREGHRIAGGRILDDETRIKLKQDRNVGFGARTASATEGDPLAFVFNLDPAPAAPVRVRYELETDTLQQTDRRATAGTDCADAGTDYLLWPDTANPGAFTAEGVLDIRAGDRTAVVPAVLTCDDTLTEHGETLWLAVSVVSGEALAPEDGGARGAILDNDTARMTITPEPDPAAGEEGQDEPLRFTVSLNVGDQPARPIEPVTADYEIRGGTTGPATLPGSTGADLEVTLDTATPSELSGATLSGTLTFDTGSTDHVFEITLLPDLDDELEETFELALTNPSWPDVFDGDPGAADPPELAATGTIVNVQPPLLAVDGFTGPENSQQQFTVRLSDGPDDRTVTVRYDLVTDPDAPHGATPGLDFTAVAPAVLADGELAFDPGTTEQTVGVWLRRDVVSEPDEKLRLVLRDPANALLRDIDTEPGVQAYGQGTITDVDANFLVVDDPTALENDVLTFTVTLCDPVAGRTVTVDYEVQARSARILDPANPPDPDTPPELRPDFQPLGPASGTLTFQDSMPVEQLADVCEDGVTAEAKRRTVAVQTLDDLVAEQDETLHLVLTGQSPSGTGLEKATGVGTIVNVNTATVRVTSPRAREGERLDFVISLEDDDGHPARILDPVTVYYATEDVTASAADGDYTPVPADPAQCLGRDSPPAGCPFVTFEPATAGNPDPARTHTVAVAAGTDRLDEDDETVALVVWLAPDIVNTNLGDARGVGTVVDADPPALHIEDATAAEGGTMEFTIRLVTRDEAGEPVDTATSEVVTVLVSTEDETATAGADYTPTSRRVTFLPGQTSRPFRVAIATDNDVENPDERFRVVLSEERNAGYDRSIAFGTITPACARWGVDPAPTITVLEATVIEGQSYSPEVVFSRPVCHDYSLQVRFTSGTATCGSDLGWCPGPTPRVEQQQAADSMPLSRNLLTATAVDDTLYEGDEQMTFDVRWGPVWQSWGGAAWVSGPVTIRDNDPPPRVSIAEAAAPRGDAITFEVTLDTASGLPVNVQYRTVPGSGSATATTPGAAGDYAPRGWTDLTIGAGPARDPDSTRATFSVATAPDDDTEPGDETFLVELRAPPEGGAPLNALIVDGSAVGTILEGDLPRLSIDDADADEGRTMRFRVWLSEPAAAAVTVDYATEDLTASAAEGDYTPATGTLDFDAGDSEKFIDVAVLTDSVREIDERFQVVLSNAPGLSLADGSAVGTINGEPCLDLTPPGAPRPAITVSPASAAESDGSLTFAVAMEQPVCQPVRAQTGISPAGGTATRGADYIWRQASTELRGTATESSLAVQLVDDEVDELDETVRLEVSVQVDTPRDTVTWSLGEVEGTIIDDDTAVLSVSDAEAQEGSVLSFVVRMDRPSSRTVTVRYATEDGGTNPAEAAGDYLAVAAATVTIPAGELSAPARVWTLEDSIDELDETLRVRLSSPTGGAGLAAGDGPVATGTIIDDDDPPALSILDAAGAEGETLVFEVRLTGSSGRPVHFFYRTIDGTAEAGDDYDGTSGTRIDIPAGDTTASIRVDALTDGVVESDETFELVVYSAPNLDRSGFTRPTGTIRDLTDRGLAVSDAYVLEGGLLAFDVGFTGLPSTRDITVEYRTSPGTATAGDDYTDDYESQRAELRILAGQTSATIHVQTVDDSLDEDAEELTLTLSNPRHAVILDEEAKGVIIDDDRMPSLSINDPAVTEGPGATATFHVQLSERSGRNVTVDFATEPGTATAGDDYVARSGPLEILAGGQRGTVTVALVNDDVSESVERFRLTLSNADHASLDDGTGVATIVDDDAPPQVLVASPAAVREGPGNSAVFEVRLSRSSPVAVTVSYTTKDATAIAGDDYTAVSGTVTFAAGSTAAQRVTVALVNDDTGEDPETFGLVLSVAPGAGADIGAGTATVLVLDDDNLPTLSVADASPVAEAAGATVTFTVSLSRAVPEAVTVDYSTLIDPTAGAEKAAIFPQDLNHQSGTLTIAARDTSATVSVALKDDLFDEHDETFWLRLNNPSEATVLDGTGIGTIRDNDPLPQLSLADAVTDEGGTLSLTARLASASGRTVTSSWATEALPVATGAATPGADYVTGGGTLTFAPGRTGADFEVILLQDEISETDESFLVRLGTTVHASLDAASATAVIRDDDGLPRVSIADTEVVEDNSPGVFIVTLTHPSSQPITVTYTTSDGTATAGTAENPVDYGTDTKTLTIPAGQTSGEISVFIVDDDIAEDTETFFVTLSSPVHAVVSEVGHKAVGYILDNERPRISIGVATAEEGDGTIRFPITLSNPVAGGATVRYTTFDGSATQPNDYVASSQTLTIGAGATTAAVTVKLTDDTFREETEQFLVRLDNASNASISVAEAMGVILDDDQLPSLSVESPLFVDEDAGSVTVPFTLSFPVDVEVTFDYETEPSTRSSTCPQPYVHQEGSLSIAPGGTRVEIEIPIVDDPDACAERISEFSDLDRLTLRLYRSFRVAASNIRNALPFFHKPTINVVDLQQLPCITLDRMSDVWEDAGTATFTIRLNRAVNSDVIVEVATVEPDVRPGLGGLQFGFFEAFAVAPADFIALSDHRVTIPAGSTSVPVEVSIVNDDVPEPTERFDLSATRVVNAYWNCDVGGRRGSGSSYARAAATVRDEDTLPRVSVEDVYVTESQTANFRFRLLRPVTMWDERTENEQTVRVERIEWVERTYNSPVTVTYETVDATAVAGRDYTGSRGSLVIDPGEFGAGVEVTVADDGIEEPDETFTLRFSASGADVPDGEATATIVGSDTGLPRLRILDVTAREDEHFITVPVRLSHWAGERVKFKFTTLEVPSLGAHAARAREDYQPYAGRANTMLGTRGQVQVSFAPSSSTHELSDRIPELNERFIVMLHDVENAVLEKAQAWVTIIDNDLPLVSVANETVHEGAGVIAFTLELHAPGVRPGTIKYTTKVRGSAGEAAASSGEDYTSVSGTVDFAVGETSKTIQVALVNDTVDEADESFLLELSDPFALEIHDGTAVGTITDDDPGWVIDDPVAWEDGDTDRTGGTLVFTATRDHTTTGAVTLSYTVAAAGIATGGTSCSDGTDYVIPSGSVVLQPADTTAAISVQLCPDSAAEGTETLVIELTGVSGRKLTGVGTITDND